MKKLAVLSLVVILALATVGVGYAAWTDSLNIDGDGSTGSLNVQFTGVSGGTLSADSEGYLGGVDDTLTWDIPAEMVPGDTTTLTYQLTNIGTADALVSVGALTGVPAGIIVTGDSVADVDVNSGDTSAVFSITLEMTAAADMGVSFSVAKSFTANIG